MVNYIKDVLHLKGVKQNWLATKIGVTYNTVSNWYQNKALLSLQVLKQFSEVLGVDITELLKPQVK